MKSFGWVLASLALHGALLAAMMVGLVPVERMVRELEPITFEIEEPAIAAVAPSLPVEPVHEQPTEPEEPELPDPEPDPIEPPPPSIQPDRPVERPAEPRDVDPGPPSQEGGDASGTDGAPSEGTSGPNVEVPEVEGGPGPVDDEERERLRVLVDPSRVARSGLDFGPGPSQRSGPAGLASLHGPGPSRAEVERGLSSSLRSEAMTKNHLERAPFRLQRRSDGTQVWQGPRLTGIINPDGTVRFEDRPNVQTEGFSASGTFDLTEAIMGAEGQDPLRAEREYFMRQTEELCAQLEAEHRRREMSQGLSRLPGRLEGIWAATRRTPAERRARIFSIWDEMVDDENGARGRAIIIRWIRERLPEGSEHAYTDEEIRRFNASRESREEFAPY